MNSKVPNNPSDRGQCPPSRCGASSTAVWWVIAVSLAVIAVCLVIRADEKLTPTTAAQTYSGASARGVMAFPAQMTKSTFGLYMVDVDAGTLWCYEYTANRKLRFAAARSWRFDRYLEDFNCDELSPREVEAMVEKARQQQLQPGQPSP